MRGLPSQVKGAGFRVQSRRCSWVRIPSPAPKHIDFAFDISPAIYFAIWVLVYEFCRDMDRIQSSLNPAPLTWLGNPNTARNSTTVRGSTCNLVNRGRACLLMAFYGILLCHSNSNLPPGRISALKKPYSYQERVCDVREGINPTIHRNCSMTYAL